MSAHAHQDGRAAGLSGIEFGAAFHRDAVGPLLSQELPGLRYAAARLGSGSDVLGLDDVMSRDHDWGGRLTLLVDGAAQAAVPVVRDLDQWVDSVDVLAHPGRRAALTAAYRAWLDAAGPPAQT